MNSFFDSFSDSSSPVGVLTKSATDPTLTGPDWSKNMDICDMINSSRDSSDADRAAKSIHRRLQEADPKIISLSLTLAETCMKNCHGFAKAVDQAFMDEMVGISRGTKGKDNGNEALRMIQEWAKGLHPKDGGQSTFHDTYRAMKQRGVVFPDGDDIAPTAAFDMPAKPDVVRPRTDQDFTSKLEKDLATVFEKIKLCREMMQESPGIVEDDALAEVIGFLEACRDRMADVIEAGTQGLLSETLLAESFRANDAIFRTLDAEKVSLRLLCISLSRFICTSLTPSFLPLSIYSEWPEDRGGRRRGLGDQAGGNRPPRPRRDIRARVEERTSE